MANEASADVTWTDGVRDWWADLWAGDGDAAADPGVEGEGEEVPAAEGGGTSSTSSGKAGSAIFNVLICWIACVLRHVITPELWLQFTPGRWLAFVWATAKVESGYSAIAVNPDGGAEGLLQYVPGNVKALGVKAGSPWSQGWHAPQLMAEMCNSMSWWFRLFLPGGTAMRALWHYGPDDKDGMDKVKSEKSFFYAYWPARLVGIVVDLPYMFLLPFSLVWWLRWSRKKGRR